MIQPSKTMKQEIIKARRSLSGFAKGLRLIVLCLAGCAVAQGAAIESWLAKPLDGRSKDAPALKAPLTKAEALRVRQLLVDDLAARLVKERKEEVEKKVITLGDKVMPWLEKTCGQAPKDGRSLWISMHGGGGAPKTVNDGQWKNQLGLYNPPEGVYIAPRAATDTACLWYEGHIDPMFQRLIEDQVLFAGVNPDKVYLMGYSAGGDGVWQLSPRMADRFAAAAMMAGHPNGVPLLGLRNLPFAIFVGELDAAYARNAAVIGHTKVLDQLEKDDPGSYVHLLRVYQGLGHWMNLKDAEAVPWMAKYQRQTWPRKIVWPGNAVHRRFYWLRIPDDAEPARKMTARVESNTIHLDGEVPARTELRLSDDLLDLDQPVVVIVNDKQVFSGKFARNAAAILRCLDERFDPKAAATAICTLPETP